VRRVRVCEPRLGGLAMQVPGGLAVRDVSADHDGHVRAFKKHRSREWAAAVKRPMLRPPMLAGRGERPRSTVRWSESEQFMCVVNDGCLRRLARLWE